jgi:hypothetical protein
MLCGNAPKDAPLDTGVSHGVIFYVLIKDIFVKTGCGGIGFASPAIRCIRPSPLMRR